MPFIVFEGGEGVGKSTQLTLLAAELQKRGLKVLTTREPGGTPFAESLRRIFKDPAVQGDEPTAWAELLVVAAARAQHLTKLIRPERQQGTWVLCDRFLDSAFVYQGMRGSLGPATVSALHRLFMEPQDVPDITLILDLDPSMATLRVGNRQGKPQGDRLDSMPFDLHRGLRDGFVALAQQGIPYPCGTVPNRIIIDAAGSTAAVAALINQGVGLCDPQGDGHG
jgi:dTMP kinase